jgi:hypothetical protein
MGCDEAMYSIMQYAVQLDEDKLTEEITGFKAFLNYSRVAGYPSMHPALVYKVRIPRFGRTLCTLKIAFHKTAL